MTRFRNALQTLSQRQTAGHTMLTAATPPAEVARSEPLATGESLPEVFSAAPRATAVWPRITDLLLEAAGSGFRKLAQRLRRGALERNLCSLVFTGAGRQAGRTSLILTLARALQQEFPQERLLVLDADFQKPGVAAACGLTVTRGLWETLQCDLAWPKVLHAGPEETVSLLPLSGPVSFPELETVGTDGLLPLLSDLREHYPLILIDAGPWTPFRSMLWNLNGCDALVHVQHSTAQPEGILRMERAQCRDQGLDFLGIVETFVSAGIPVTSSPATREREFTSRALPELPAHLDLYHNDADRDEDRQGDSGETHIPAPKSGTRGAESARSRAHLRSDR